MWYHPKYYKELRKRNKSDQVISKSSHDGESERAPDSGLKQQASSSKPQASSVKPQASSVKPQAASNCRSGKVKHKHQASSSKAQASSAKRS